jgi:Uma2 family endonuclease
MGDREFFQFCRLNQDLRIERTSTGDIIVLPPTGGETGRRNFVLTGILNAWVEADGSGVGFDSSPLFSLPNGAKRSPDAAWVTRERWERLTPRQREECPPFCPDFVIELRSASDTLSTLQRKMEEYIANGAQLGWLIDPLERRVYVYRPGRRPRRLDQPTVLSADPVLRGFALDVRRLW